MSFSWQNGMQHCCQASGLFQIVTFWMGSGLLIINFKLNAFYKFNWGYNFETTNLVFRSNHTLPNWACALDCTGFIIYGVQNLKFNPVHYVILSIFRPGMRIRHNPQKNFQKDKKGRNFMESNRGACWAGMTWLSRVIEMLGLRTREVFSEVRLWMDKHLSEQDEIYCNSMC